MEDYEDGGRHFADSERQITEKMHKSATTKGYRSAVQNDIPLYSEYNNKTW